MTFVPVEWIDDAIKAALSQKAEETESSKTVITIEQGRQPEVGLH